jgi:hypothetical protein
MNEKLEMLKWADYLKWTKDLIEEYEKKGIKLSFSEALNEIRLRNIEYDMITAISTKINREIYKQNKLEEKLNFEPKKRDLRIFKNF